VRSAKSKLKPAQLLVEHLFLEKTLPGPVLDLACGEAHNSIFLALKGVKVISGDLSSEALERAGELAAECGAEISVWQVDLEPEGVNPLPEHASRACLRGNSDFSLFAQAPDTLHKKGFEKRGIAAI